MSAIGFIVDYHVGGSAQRDPGLRRMAAFFERAGAEVADVGKHILPKISEELGEIIAEQFEAEGQGPDVGKWKPLSKKYEAWKERHFPGMPTLQRTGIMMAGLISSSASTARRDINGNSLVFGTRGVPYASYHQDGAEEMPARPPIDLGTSERARIVRAVRSAVTAAIREADQDNFLSLQDFAGDKYEGQAVQTGKRGGRYILTGKSMKSKLYLKQRGEEVVTARYGPRKKAK